jgi:hypothetical protein
MRPPVQREPDRVHQQHAPDASGDGDGFDRVRQPLPQRPAVRHQRGPGQPERRHPDQNGDDCQQLRAQEELQEQQDPEPDAAPTRRMFLPHHNVVQHGQHEREQH